MLWLFGDLGGILGQGQGWEGGDAALGVLKCWGIAVLLLFILDFLWLETQAGHPTFPVRS